MPRSADPSWSFAAAGTAGTAADRDPDRTDHRRPHAGFPVGHAVAGRIRRFDRVGGGPVRDGRTTTRSGIGASAQPGRSGPAVPVRPGAGRTGRRRAGRSNRVDRFAVRPPGTAVANPEGAQVDTNDIPPERQRIVDALTPREWDELVDLIVDRLEDRVRDELARRGRRFSPGVF